MKLDHADSGLYRILLNLFIDRIGQNHDAFGKGRQVLDYLYELTWRNEPRGVGHANESQSMNAHLGDGIGLVRLGQAANFDLRCMHS